MIFNVVHCHIQELGLVWSTWAVLRRCTYWRHLTWVLLMKVGLEPKFAGENLYVVLIFTIIMLQTFVRRAVSAIATVATIVPTRCRWTILVDYFKRHLKVPIVERWVVLGFRDCRRLLSSGSWLVECSIELRFIICSVACIYFALDILLLLFAKRVVLLLQALA